MFDYSTLLEIRKLELFLNSGESHLEERSISRQKPNILENVINYFIGKSPFCYKYQYNKNIDDIEYSFSRTFVGDLKSIKDYFINIIKRTNQIF